MSRRWCLVQIQAAQTYAISSTEETGSYGSTSTPQSQRDILGFQIGFQSFVGQLSS
jgi:hypothetical protein